MRSSDLAGARVLILGTGREAMALAESLHDRVASLSAADDVEGAGASAWRERWGDAVPLAIAPAPEDYRGRIDVVLASPGIPRAAPLRSALAAMDVPESSGTDLWLSEHAPATIGITGSKGKSTTSALTHAILRAHGVDAALGGNIGIPLLALGPAERYVAELSSYQSSSVTVSPDVAVLTALFPEHLDWHGSEAAYYADKLNLIGHSPRVVVVNGEDPRLQEQLARLHPDAPLAPVGDVAGARWRLDDEVISRDGRAFVPRSRLSVMGRHNALNAALALAAAEASGVDLDPEASGQALADFAPLDHRLQQITDPSGLLFVDDSLSTSPFATVAALRAFDRDDIVLLVGGQDRGVPTTPLAEHLAVSPIAGIVGLPDSGPRLVADLAGTGVPSELAADMDDAVRIARRLAPAGGLVLLSPGAPSYGRYKDFADRGRAFREAIEGSSGVH